MLLESFLAFTHIMAFLMLATFMTSETALCRTEWISAPIVHRLVRLNFLTLLSGALLLATGLARSGWGIKGANWYWSQPLLHTKLTLLVVMLALAAAAGRHYRQWRAALTTDGQLPSAPALRTARRLEMWASHLMIVVVLLAVLLARGVGTR